MEKKIMKCPMCGTEMVSGRENFKYEASGLDYVTLVNIEVRRCGKCGEWEAVIPHMEDLHRVIARTIARLPSRLRGNEIRFLRTYLGLSSADAAEMLGVAPGTMSRWENEKSKSEMSLGFERLLRLMVFNRDPVQSYPLDELKEKRTRALKKPSPIRFLRKGQDWQSATA
jgi:putative zinc finger/helix-turn-helix YgiT family protein